MKQRIFLILAILFLLTACAVQTDEQSLHCSLCIDCTTLLENTEKLPDEKRELVPADGILYKNTDVAFSEGETVLDVLVRALQQSSIHYEYSGSPQTAYIEGIGNLYEFDAGPLSGWEYRINGEFPGVGCGQYTLHDGDEITWYYTCDLGADIGNALLEP